MRAAAPPSVTPVAVPRRLRLFFRLAFAALLAATLALALGVLHDEKRRSQRAYAEGLRKSEAQIAARLRHPTGQLMLLNAALADLPATPLVPLVLPFGAIDFDDRAKAQQAVELAGCGVVYGDGASLCAGIGSNPFAGAFVYVVGQIPTPTLVPHRSGQLDLSQAHRAWVEVRLAGGESWRWIAPYQAQGDTGLAPAAPAQGASAAAAAAQRGRLVAFDADAELNADSRPRKDVRGWMWQEGGCIGEPRSVAKLTAAVPAGSGAAASAAAAGAASAAGATASAAGAMAANGATGATGATGAASAMGAASATSAAIAAIAAASSSVAAPAAGASAAGASAAASSAGIASSAAPSADPSPAAPVLDCPRRTYVSLRLPVPPWREAVEARGAAAWPPPRLAGTQVRLQLFGPGEGNVLFDSDNPGRSGTAAASAPFALAEFRRLLLPGETLRVQREGSDGVILEARGADTDGSAVAADGLQRFADMAMDALVRWLPVQGYDTPVEQHATIATRLGNYRLTLVGDLRSVTRQLAAVATRLAGYVAAMLGAVVVVWLLLEVVVMRRIVLLTRRAAAVSDGMRQAAMPGGAGAGRGAERPPLALTLEVGDLSRRDELGVLAQALRDLLARVNADVERERIRARHERDQWHAVGHEIVSPLQSLIALHGSDNDPAARYLRRMQQAVGVLYGQASPSEAFESTQLTLSRLDLDAFAAMVAGNAHHIGIADVRYQPAGSGSAAGDPARAAWVMADEHSLEDVLTHVLRNAERHREPGTPITLALARGTAAANGAQGTWHLRVHNRGPAIAQAMLERIFEYGVSADPLDEPGRTDPPLYPQGHGDGANGARRGQGLFVARTYMAKMGGTITARNVRDGVEFVLTLPQAEGAEGSAKR